jgi:cobyrinic acid a,c-diamide synthase
MCGVLDASARVTDLLVIGYREATAQTSSPLAAAGARLVGYKHHRSQVLPRSGVSPAWAWPGGQPEGFVWRGVHASFLNLHWAGAPEIAVRLVAAARQSGGPAPIPVSPAEGWAGTAGAAGALLAPAGPAEVWAGTAPTSPAPIGDEPATQALEL